VKEDSHSATAIAQPEMPSISGSFESASGG